MKSILSFLRQLARHNDREWFNTHKEEYLRVRRRADELAQRFINVVAEVDPEAAHLSVADCTYRIYRDTRFSADKTPYKTHIGIFVNPPYGKKSERCGYYLHIEPGNVFFCAGTVCLPSKVVTAIRRSIFDDIDEYRDIVESEEFRRLLPNLGMNPVKTAPKGFDRDWEYIDYVRPRDFIAYSDPYPKEEVEKSDFIESLLPAVKEARRFNDFVNFSIENFVD
ncbi:MAG: DUF2461 domain-containing protein [Bacteroidales bacterium]|nr:DUF2461 domain-containing protein [Bacteroidales bacterium]